MNILIHCRVKVKKILLEAFAKKKALDRLSHIRHTSTVFTVFYRLQKGVQYRRRRVFWEHIVESDTAVSSRRVECRERVERSVRKKDPKRSAAKESLKGSRKEVCQKERERTTLSRVERKRIFTRF